MRLLSITAGLFAMVFLGSIYVLAIPQDRPAGEPRFTISIEPPTDQKSANLAPAASATGMTVQRSSDRLPASGGTGSSGASSTTGNAARDPQVSALPSGIPAGAPVGNGQMQIHRLNGNGGATGFPSLPSIAAAPSASPSPLPPGMVLAAPPAPAVPRGKQGAVDTGTSQGFALQGLTLSGADPQLTRAPTE